MQPFYSSKIITSSITGASSYNIYVFEQLDTEDVVLVTTIPESSTSTEVTSLKAGTDYVIELKSVGNNDVESTDTTQFNVITCEQRLRFLYVFAVAFNLR